MEKQQEKKKIVRKVENEHGRLRNLISYAFSLWMANDWLAGWLY